MRTHPIVEYYQALRDSAPCLSRAATLPKGTKLGLGKRRAPGNTIILSQPYRRRVSTDRLNREGSQLAASLEGEPGPTPAGKTLPHSFPETSRFRRERARDVPIMNGRRRGTREESRKQALGSAWSMEMSKLTRDWTAEPVSRDQILRRERGQRIIHFPCSAADHEQDWQPCPVVRAIHT